MNDLKQNQDMLELSKKASEAAADALADTADAAGSTYQRIETGVVRGYKAVETGVVKGYKAVENAVVGTYTKIEDIFVDQFLRREGETIAEAKQRLKNVSPENTEE